jgi:lysozyme
MRNLPSRAFLTASLKLWTRRLAYRRGRVKHWTRKHSAWRVKRWEGLVRVAEHNVSRRRRQLADLGPVKGVDVSNNNGRVDFQKIRAAGYRFVFCKASEGTTFTDGFFQGNVRAARAAGLKVGAYHFLNSADGAVQARVFAQHVKAAGLKKGDLLPVVDVEKAGVNASHVAGFVNECHRVLGVRPLIYTFPSFMRWDSTFGCKLWIANFNVRKPTIPAPWTGYAAWQHSSTASVPGVAGDCDVNVAPSLNAVLW